MKKFILLLFVVVNCYASQVSMSESRRRLMTLGCFMQQSMFYDSGGNLELLQLSHQISQCRSATDFLIKCSQVARLNEIYSEKVDANRELQAARCIINEKLIVSLSLVAKNNGWNQNLIPVRNESPVNVSRVKAQRVKAQRVKAQRVKAQRAEAQRADTPLSELSHSDVEPYYPSKTAFYTDGDYYSDDSHSLGHTFANPSDRSHGTHQASSHDSEDDLA